MLFDVFVEVCRDKNVGRQDFIKLREVEEMFTDLQCIDEPSLKLSKPLPKKWTFWIRLDG